MKATRVLVDGLVQGVGFRFFAERAARDLGVRGWVRNLPDGRVEAVAAGPGDRVEAFVDRLRRGPRGARVEGVETGEAELAEDDPRGFEIRF